MMNKKDFECAAKCFNSMGNFMSRSNVMGSLILMNIGMWILTFCILVCTAKFGLSESILLFILIVDFLLLVATLVAYGYFAVKMPSLLHSETWWHGMFNLIGASKGNPVLTDVIDAECISVGRELKEIGLKKAIETSNETEEEKLPIVVEEGE